MSKESFSLLKGLGYQILHRMGSQKFIPAFPPRTVKSKAKEKRLKLIKKLIIECLYDLKITGRVKRCEDLASVSLKIQDILCSPEYCNMKNIDKLRYTIAQLIVDPHHRRAVEAIIKRNKEQELPKFKPICNIAKIKSHSAVLETAFKYYTDAWNPEKQRYRKNKAGRYFHLAMKDLLSKDWLHKYCILAGYVPVGKCRKLSEIGRILATSCGCRKVDRFRYKKSFMEKLRKEAMNYRYHTMNRTLKTINHRCIVRLHRRPHEESHVVFGKQLKPGVCTRVFMATHSQLIEPAEAGSDDQSSLASEKEFVKAKLKDMSSPQFSSTVASNVAIKVFVTSANLPFKLLPARVVTQLELSTVLNHPNIVRFIETFATKRDIFMVMRFEENRNLHHILTNNGRLMQKTAKVWTFQIALALQYLHYAGIVHRNVKCNNILITQDYNAILTGFGSAKVRWMDLPHVRTAESRNYNVGYPPYRAPEVLMKKPYCMAPVDIWSLGVILFVMLNNNFPFCYHNKKLMLRLQMLKKWKKAWNRDFPTSKLCLNLLKQILEPEPSQRLDIDDVVSHQWFKKLPVPKVHKKALKRAPFLFFYRDSKIIDDNVGAPPIPSHKYDKDTLEEINATLATIINRSEKRTIKPVDDLPGYQACYPKNIRPNNLLSKIEASLKTPTRRIYRQKSNIEYEPYISEREEFEMHEKTTANIEELKERTEQVRKILEPSHKEDKVKKALGEIVNKVKEKTERMKVHQEELIKKVAMFMPKAVASPESEPRSILQMKSLSTRERLVLELRNKNVSMSKLSISTTNEWRSGLGVKHSKDFSNMDFASIVTLSKNKIGLDETKLPELGFVKHHTSRSFSDIKLGGSKQDIKQEEEANSE